MEINFFKFVDIIDFADVFKTIDVFAFVEGNSAMANATAAAFGPNSHTETLTQTLAEQFEASASASESLSATNFFHFFQLDGLVVA